jgi:hypothetical protein
MDQGKALLGRVLDVHVRGMDLLRGATIGEDWHHLMLALATCSYNSLLVGVTAIRDGFPVQAMILARAIYEDIQTADHIRANPSDRKFWLDLKYGANEKAAEEVPRFGSMRRSMPDQQTARWLREAYFTLSQYSHPTARSLRAEWHR